jgi:hypothetical protein
MHDTGCHVKKNVDIWDATGKEKHEQAAIKERRRKKKVIQDKWSMW